MLCATCWEALVSFESTWKHRPYTKGDSCTSDLFLCFKGSSGCWESAILITKQQISNKVEMHKNVVETITGMNFEKLRGFQNNQGGWGPHQQKLQNLFLSIQLVSLHLLTELTLILAVVWLWLSGEGLLAVAVPGEARVGKVMSWMPCDSACCCFWRSLSNWAWAWAVSWLNRGYWASCCSSVSDSTGMAWGKDKDVLLEVRTNCFSA